MRNEYQNKKLISHSLTLKMQSELDQRRALNLQHYKYKIARIEQIAGGARGQVEEKRRNEAIEVKEKGKKIRSKGKVPVKFFCFYCR